VIKSLIIVSIIMAPKHSVTKVKKPYFMLFFTNNDIFDVFVKEDYMLELLSKVVYVHTAF